jgi:MoxR-like ATPase
MTKSSKGSSEPKTANTQANNFSILERIGLFGLSEIEPIIIAALVTDEPLLLIGSHGTGKSLLLTKIAQALNLEFRHYNASLLNFDDLVGFPVPDPNGVLKYVKTPASIWGARAVIFDEISRCRLDIQNKLFPIIHERRVQGLLLEELRYRWAAMNPPISEDEQDGYIGSEPLDPALADRFAFIVRMPAWDHFSEVEQLSIIKATDTTVPTIADSDALQRIILTTRVAVPKVKDAIGENVAVYVRGLAALLDQAKIPLSPRRAGMLLRNILAVHAAMLLVDADTNPSDSALLTVRNSLPQVADGIKIPETKLLGAHREAWRLAGIKSNDPLKAILMSSDPVERVRLAVSAKKLNKNDFSAVIADAISLLSAGAREAAVVYLFENDAVGRLNAAVAEQVAQTYADVVTSLNFSETLHARNPRFQTWQRIKDILSRLDQANPRCHLAANTLAKCFAQKQISSPEDAERAFSEWMQTDACLSGAAV